jgi:hypothetical protein
MEAGMGSMDTLLASGDVERRSPSVLQAVATEFAALPPARRDAAAARLAERFDQACVVMPRRRYEEAEFKAKQFSYAVESIRTHQSTSTALGSVLLDQFALAARSALETAALSGEAAGDESVPADGAADDLGLAADVAELLERTASEDSRLADLLSLAGNYDAQARLFESGALAAESFMSGHAVMVGEVLRSIRMKLALGEQYAQERSPIELFLSAPRREGRFGEQPRG